MSGRLYLLGREFSRQTARGPKGMGAHLMVDASANTMQPRAQAALANSPFYELRDLQVDQRADALLIAGSVSSFYHKQLAQEVVRSVCADMRVINAIRVESEEDEA